MRTEKSPTRMDCSAFRRSSSSGDAPPLTRLSGISAGTAVGEGPLVLSSPTGSLFGCIVSSGADEPPHDVTSVGALSRPYEGAAAIFGLVGLRQSPLATWDWNRPGPASAAAAMARADGPPTGWSPRAIHRPERMNVLRPVGSGHVPVPLGASRSDHLLTPQTRQRSNGSADRGQNFHQQEMSMNFRTLAPRRKEDYARGSGPGPRGRRVNRGATETAQTIRFGE